MLVASAPLVACVAPPDDLETQRGAAVDICATAPEGALCDDKNVCTLFDVCKAGVCKGSASPNGTYIEVSDIDDVERRLGDPLSTSAGDLDPTSSSRSWSTIATVFRAPSWPAGTASPVSPSSLFFGGTAWTSANNR